MVSETDVFEQIAKCNHILMLTSCIDYFDEQSKQQIAAFEEALAQGRGVAVLDGRIVENLHVETARATLDRAAAIGALAQG